jgi:hypothetical protein
MNLRSKRSGKDFLNGRELRASRLPAADPLERVASSLPSFLNLPTVTKVARDFLENGLMVVTSTARFQQQREVTQNISYQVVFVGSQACRAARWELIELPLLKEQARRFMDALDASSPILASIADADVEKISLELSDFMKSTSDLPRAHLSAIQDAARLFQSMCARFYEQFPYNIRPNTNRDELSWHFIDGMARLYEKITGKQPAKSKAGPFVRFLAAAWVDFQWPAPLDRNGRERDDIEGWLGERVEKHPSITRRKPLPKKA